MDFGNDGFQIGRSFISPTPGKANLTQSQSICTNGQEVLNRNAQLVYHDQSNWLEPGILNRVNQVTQSDWFDSADTPRNFRVEAPKQTLPGSYSYFNTWQAGEGSNSHVYGDISRGLDTWQAAEALNSLYNVNHKFPVDDNDSLTQLAFRSLLAHGNAGGNASSGNAVAQTDFFEPGSSFPSQIGGSHPTISFGNLSVPDIVRDGSTVRSRPLFDLNSSAEIVSDIAAYSENISFQFAPITPQKTNAAEEQRQKSSMVYATNYAHEKTTNEDTVKELEKKQRSHVVTAQFRKTVPRKLQENHKPDKRGTEEAEFIKTPKQTPRRKKHRPKVIIEGQSKTTPKPRGRKLPVPEESTEFKRKYVRRNGTNNPVNSPLEREISEIYSTGDTPTTKENVSIKRTYSRRKAINTPEASKNEESVVTDVNTTPYTRSSCRRSLNFEPEGQVRGESSSFSRFTNRDIDQSTVHSQQEAEVMANFFPDMRVAYELTQSANQVLQDYLSMPDNRFCSSTPVKGKCQIVFSDVTLGKEVTAVQVTANPGDQCSLESARDSIYRSTHLTPDIQSRISKRPRTGVADEAEIRNLTGSYHNFIQRYLSMFSYNPDKNDCTPGMLFPTIYKKKRTAKVYHEESFSLNSTVSASSSHARGEELTSAHSYLPLFYSKTNQGSSTSPFQVTNLLNSHSANDDAMHKRICLEDRLTVGPIAVIKKKRSNLPTRVRNVASLLVCKEVKRSLGRASKSSKVPQVREPFTCMKSLVAYTPATLRTKKRSNRSLLAPSSVQNIPNHHTFAGQRLALTWKSMSPVDLIIEQLMQLSLNAVHDRQQHDQSLVPFQMGGALITFEGIDPIKIKQLRPRVDLDDETTRVWKLLLENLNSEGVNGTTQEKEKYWEEERRVFKGRADSFIARMHLIQGDRRFTPWKGSVVDSAIGVFLTQNVSDHLSSSAFMSVASRFPIVNSVESSRNSSCDSVPTENIGCQQQDMSNSDPLKSCETEANKSISFIGNGRDVDDTFSSQTSTISSQNSADSPTSLRERTARNSLSNAEEGPVLGIEQNNFTSFSSFHRLLQMADTVMHDCCKDYNCRKEIDENHQVQPESPQNVTDVTDNSSSFNGSRKYEHKEVNSKIAREDPNGPKANRKTPKGPKSKGKIRKEKKNAVNWDDLRKEAQKDGKRERTANTMDSVDWDAVRCADVKEIADTIKERGMNNMLAERIKDFLNRLVRDHESIDLEWLRDVEPDKAKEYLMSFRGLGLKSVECVRLLTLHHVAFPVDTNVGRIAVRLGWVPLQPLPESLQLHLLEMYPILETVQKYLWPRLCKLDQRTLYELHYQMITFGKVFCTKSKPNCNSCPMRGECRHFASAFASARLALPAPEEKRMVVAPENIETGQNSMNRTNAFLLPSPLPISEERNFITTVENPMGVLASMQFTSSRANNTEASSSRPIVEEPSTPEPVIELPTTPEPECNEVSELDIEDSFYEDPDEIPTIDFQMEQFTQNLQNFMEQNSELLEGDMSKALVALTPEAASIPVPKLKNISRLRTEHLVYELPDTHPLLEGLDKREPDDPSPYLLAIWTPGETVDSTKPPEIRCNSQDTSKLCPDKTCLSCNSVREQHSQTVRGTILIPCRTAMRGSFPLNGTYFQVNEVFSDHESSRNPIDVPRQWLWNLPRRTVYFGTSIPTIFKGLTTAEIQYCFWRGLVCVRGFDRKTRAPRPLIARLHFPVSKLEKENVKGKGKADE